MTFTEIKTSLAAAGKPVEDAQLYRYLRAFRIKPVGVLTRPRNYPEGSAELILTHLGLRPQPNGVTLILQTTKEALDRKFNGKLVTLPTLKRARKISSELRKSTRAGR